MAKINGKDDEGVEIIFPRSIKFREAKDLCYHLFAIIDSDVYLTLNENNEKTVPNKESDEYQSLTSYKSPRKTLSGEIMRANDGASIEFEFNLNNSNEFNRSLYDRIKIKIGKYNDDSYVSENHNTLAVFVDEIMHSIEEYSKRYFRSDKAR